MSFSSYYIIHLELHLNPIIPIMLSISFRIFSHGSQYDTRFLFFKVVFLEYFPSKILFESWKDS